jgi:hypothetical protein
MILGDGFEEHYLEVLICSAICRALLTWYKSLFCFIKEENWLKERGLL